MSATVRCTVLALSLAALPLTAQTGVWTAVGSTGSIDEASLGIYATGTINLAHLGANVGTVVSRFNVTNTFGGGMTDVPPWTTLEMTYFDIAAAGSVTAILLEVNRCSNVSNILCSVTSTDALTPTCSTCTLSAGTTMNFGANNYVVEVRVNRAAANVAPQLFGLRIF